MFLSNQLCWFLGMSFEEHVRQLLPCETSPSVSFDSLCCTREQWLNITIQEEALDFHAKEGLQAALNYISEYQKELEGVHIVTSSFLCELHKRVMGKDLRGGYI